jgi:hypothetical protein
MKGEIKAKPAADLAELPELLSVKRVHPELSLISKHNQVKFPSM